MSNFNIKMVVFLFVLLGFSVHATRYIEYKKAEPITINVSAANKDLSINFNEKVALGTPSGFKKYFRFQLIDSVLYLKAVKKSNKTFRVLAKGNSKHYVLDVRQISEGTNEAIEIVSTKKIAKKSRFSKKQQVSDITLVRYVSQQLYAPKYAIEPVSGVNVVAHNLPNELDFIYAYGGLRVTPIIAFKAGELTVTALRVKNKSNVTRKVLDMKGFSLRTNALSATPQHNELGVLSIDNETAVYIVTRNSLAENLKIRGVY